MPSFLLGRYSGLVVFLLGAVGGLGFAPLHAGILALASYPCWYRIMYADEFISLGRRRFMFRSFWLGYLFYVGNYVVSLFWIGEAPGHAFSDLWWLGIVAMIFIPLFLGLFAGLACGVASFASRGYQRILFLVMLLSLAEYARGYMFTGFPWNMPVHLLTGSSELLQNVSWLGLYGGNCVMLLILLLPASLLYEGRGIYVGGVVSLGLLVVGYGYGSWRLSESLLPMEPSHGVRIVQPNVFGSDRFDSERVSLNFLESLRLSAKDLPVWVDTIIWGEAVVPFDFSTNRSALSALSAILPSGINFISGVAHYSRDSNIFYNSMLGLSVGVEGKILEYNKHHLVPFGEYVPLSEYSPIPAIAAQGNKYGRGGAPQTIVSDYFPSMIPLICYEIIFPNLRRDAYGSGVEGAQWILNITNDEWYRPDLTSLPVGYYQHLQMARFAAVESGLPVVRAASTGISAIIDRHGVIIDEIAYGRSGSIDSLLPSGLASVSLIYGDIIFLVVMSILLLAWFVVMLYIRYADMYWRRRI